METKLISKKQIECNHDWEYSALSSNFNFSDAHPHISLSEAQQSLVNSLPILWNESNSTNTVDLELQLIDSFFSITSRDPIRSGFSPIITQSALTSVNMLAILCARNNQQVGLLHPTFYKLHDILKNHGIQAVPIEENTLIKIARGEDPCLELETGDVLFIVDVNNPTGFSISSSCGENGYNNIAKYATRHGLTLVVDLCFNWFAQTSPNSNFDIYKILKRHQTSFICFEDYAKVSPVEETKVSLVVTSDEQYCQIAKLNEGFMLSPSPFILRLGIEFIRDLKNGGLARDFSIIKDNRNCAKELLSNTFLEIVDADTVSNVIWLRSRNGQISGDDFVQYCKQEDLHLVSGVQYFWADNQMGSQFIRVACLRNVADFKTGMLKIAELANNFENRLSYSKA